MLTRKKEEKKEIYAEEGKRGEIYYFRKRKSVFVFGLFLDNIFDLCAVLIYFDAFATSHATTFVKSP